MALLPNVDIDPRFRTSEVPQPFQYQPPPLRPDNTAVVVVDMVNWMFSWKLATPVEANQYYRDRNESLVIPNHQRLIQACRQTGAKVVYLRVGAYQNDYSDAVPAWRRAFEAADARDGTKACEVIEELAPEPGDVSLVKTGSGGFSGSGLDSHLRNMGIQHVLYTGVVTNACVLLTLVAGFDLGYHGYLVTDATATMSSTLQEAAVGIASVYARPVTTDAAITELRSSAG